jgi:hypothetical protein
VSVDAERFNPSVWKDEMKFSVIEIRISTVNNGVMVRTKQYEIFHLIRPAARTINDVMSLG